MSEETLSRIEYTDEETTVGLHRRKYICVHGSTLSECYEYYMKIKGDEP